MTRPTKKGARRILFVVFSEPGHLNPTIPVAQRLHRDGHEVAYFAYEDVGPRLERAGLSVPCFHVSTPPDPQETTQPRAGRSSLLSARVKNRRWYGHWIRHGLLDSVPAQIEALTGAVRQFAPDAICIDPMVYAGAVVAERLGIPWAGVSANLLSVAPPDYACHLEQNLPTFVEERAAVIGAESERMRFRFGEAISPYLNTVFTTDAFVPRALSGNDYSHLVGPSFPLDKRGDESGFPWERLRNDLPIIYVSFGGGAQFSFSPEVFRTIATAVSPDEAQVVLALTALAGEDFVQTLPAHVLAVGYAPQLEILRRASMMISHGGANSVMECLTHGRPLLVLPIAHEQPLQAYFVEVSGVGQRRDPERLEVEDCRAVVRSLLPEQSSYRARAQSIAHSYAQHDGAERTARLVLQLAEERAPIMPV